MEAGFSWCSVSRCASHSNANFIQRARIHSNRASSSDRGSGAASSWPRLFLGSGLLDLGRGPLRLAPQSLCPSSASRRGLGSRTLGPSCQRLVLDPWPLATLRRIGVLWFFSRRSSQDVPNCEQDAVTANVNLEVKNRELSSMLEEAARSDRLVAEERLQGGKDC